MTYDIYIYVFKVVSKIQKVIELSYTKYKKQIRNISFKLIILLMCYC